MQTFSLAVPPGGGGGGSGAREGRKNYVFVDEHNRHKRLKVMRACSGCRKRKIKCDSATTNIWPCSACTRLKLVCIPPTIGQEDDYSPQDQQIPGLAQQFPGVPADASLSHQPNPPQLQQQQQQQHHHHQHHHHPSSYLPSSTYPLNTYGADDPRLSQPQPYLEGPSPPDNRHFYTQHDSSMVMNMQTPQSLHPNQQNPPPVSTLFPAPPVQSAPVTASTDPYLSPEQSGAQELTDALGELKIDETGIAPYIRQQKTSEKQPEVPSPDECEDGLPPLHTARGATVRIPPELLPSDEDAVTYFEIFFNHVHPYVPVVHRAQFYQQWRHDKPSISPLLVETILACAGRGSDDPAQGAQWLALANRHEAAFMEAPRLSTLQALLLLLKAREASPKKGYYYRSWRLVKAMVSMAKDLELDEHYSYHAEGKSCGLSTVECLIQTRVWQTLLAVEIMTGGPQGRTDLGVDPNTVEVRTMWNISDLDEFETERCRQFAYFVRNALNIRLLTDAYHKAKKQKNWGADPRIMGNNSLFDRWLLSLPPGLEVTYPDDGSPPWLPSHFVGNMHSHYHLAIIMLHRPQLLASKSFDAGGEWRTHMAMCCSSAKRLCRLQEAILSSFGLSGLFHMQRGISFTLYGILTCTMLHLVAITSPDPEFHSDARMYFTRHMRLLEQCAPSWPLPEVQTQIEGLRLAFSVDVNKPFQLKPNFPYGSPMGSYQQTPPLDAAYHQPAYHHQGPMNSELHPTAAYTTTTTTNTSYNTYPITPPISGQASDKQDSSPLQGYGLAQPHAHSRDNIGHPMDGAPVVDEHNWNPTRIINQWNMAFPTSGSTQSPPSATTDPSQASPNDATTMIPGPGQQQPHQQPQAVQYAAADPSRMLPMSGQQQPLPQPYNPLQPAVISARDWQQSVASVFDPHGLKRRWDQTQQLVSQSPLPNINR